MKKIFVITIFSLASIFFVFLMVNTVSAQKDTNYGLDTVAEGKLKISSTPSEMIGKVIGGVLGFVSVIFFLLTIYGGILWMTARGNEQQTDKALHTITSASIGLAIVLGSYVLVGFLFNTIKGKSDSSAVACANPSPVVGKSCENDDSCDPNTTCSPAHICVGRSDDLCSQSCGSNFACINKSDCAEGTVKSYYCTGTAAKVCCVHK
ncbi:MAG: hypothetical protein A2373_04225 [Candidatus Magasanikbacteria bacterium RIFOXYB1_FULL_40_15]|uniref:Uncharacterized protein n=1 Tax=Candidatus Magasanikbacteria bacterium RIFOXYB1_FULL_40_15 TaxID=1798697 RepID=A0A1F6NGP9_9BACT|nr:MAG: hypothetical protein A2373_04225 [Candidatus Magasanikbacteria bacterium RIFOXYB1_FULL_40_15]